MGLTSITFDGKRMSFSSGCWQSSDADSLHPIADSRHSTNSALRGFLWGGSVIPLEKFWTQAALSKKLIFVVFSLKKMMTSLWISVCHPWNGWDCVFLAGNVQTWCVTLSRYPAPWFFSFDGLENQQIFNHVYVKHLKVLRGLSCSRFSHRKKSLPPVSVTSTLVDLCWI